MKALTLWQPWASLVACEAKPFETRRWAPPEALIGERIAIHAGKAKPAALLPEVRRSMERALNLEQRNWSRLPFGAVVCTATLAGAYQVQRLDVVGWTVEFRRALPGSAPLAAVTADHFGDYRQARWCWHLTEVEALDPPVRARGRQGLWDWPGPAATAA